MPEPAAIDDLRALIARGGARLLRSDQLQPPSLDERHRERWSLDALRGRLVELSARGATAILTTAIELVREAQLAGEPAAWIMLASSSFYPPDAAAAGIDLAALVVVQVTAPVAAARAAARLLRSGAFGLVVLDLADPTVEQAPELAMAQQGRLVTLAQTHDAAVVCLTAKPAELPSLGSLVSLRAEATRRHDPMSRPGDPGGYLAGYAGEEAMASSASAYRDDGAHELTVHILKDKQRGPGWTHTIAIAGPPGG